MNSYIEHIKRSYQFPQEGFDFKDGYLTFQGISLKYLVEKYGTPFKLIYLPKINAQIKQAIKWFDLAIQKHQYSGQYYYCYCTKCSHFSHVLSAALKEDIHLETSSSFDIDIIYKLLHKGEITKNIFLIHNGFKTDDYIEKIISLNLDGFHNSILVLDSLLEIERIRDRLPKDMPPIKIGLRMAIDDEPQSAYKTSRLGISTKEILSFVKDELVGNEKFDLKMLHFFVDSGIKDSLYYWGEFQKFINLYINIKKIYPSLSAIDIGGGFPIRNRLHFEYDYEKIIDKIIENIKRACEQDEIAEPDIFTEFGKYTVGESGAIIFQVLEQKQQNDAELWYIVDNSLMNTIPDAWTNYERFILLPINKWKNEFTKVNIGGISCDHSDYYNSEDMNQQLVLPTFSNQEEEPLYIGFFHTGAYQDSLSGYGGIKHCLIPSPKLIIIDKDETGNYVDYIYRNEQKVEDMLSILGY